MGPATVLFAGGGTGGHLFPGIALAAELAALRPGTPIVFGTGGRAIEDRALAAAGCTAVRLGPPGWRGRFLRYPRMALGLTAALARSFRFILGRRVKVVIGLGGYVSAATVTAAYILRRPVYLLEQNTIPGRTNRLCSRMADGVFIQFAAAAAYFPAGRSLPFGNPVRTAIAALRELPAPEGCVILILGGSQGAAPLNDLFAAAAAGVALPPGGRVIHICGSGNLETCRAAYAAAGVKAEVEIRDFVDDMAGVYRRTTLAVCRAGATTIAELTCVGIPMVLIPYPHATDDHQYHNGRALADAGAAVCVRQEALDGPRLAALVNGLLADPARLAAMRTASRAAGRPDAGPRIAAHIAARLAS
ncbi:MAG: UDP-N-acetylglucosamine--N-acetylmuramyl-(pentapeptide) pyrophosphoryl-undecaprenol N-acetylglucosamine transferase [Planctomycetota bacterium]